MLSQTSSTRPAIPPARPKNSKTNDAYELRGLRLMLGMGLEELAALCPRLDAGRLSRYERGRLPISQERRAGIEKVLLDEINRRVSQMSRVIANRTNGMARTKGFQGLESESPWT